jgi:hypothetical protein
MAGTRWREGTTYLQVRADGMYGLKIVKATQRRPTVVEASCVVVKVKLRIPDGAFVPLEPEAVVTVPEELVQQPIEVEAVDPS